MGVIQVVANHSGAGKTSLIGALLTRLQQEGRRSGYFRPFSTTPGDDPDVKFISRQLLSGDAPPVPLPRPVPHSGGAGLDDQLRQGVQEAVSQLNAADNVLLEGPDLAEGDGATLAAGMAELVNSKVVLVHRYAGGLDAGYVASLASPLGDRLAGVVINAFPPHRSREIKRDLVGALESRGLPVLGAIPDDRHMLAVTVQQIADHLGGRWVREAVNTDAYVDHFLIGGNIMDSGHYYFGRYQHQAVITRAERPDIQMASLMCATRCLVLTGGTQPSEYVQVEASHREVPLILVEGDTISTAEALAGLLERANGRSVSKAYRFRELMEEHLNGAAVEALLSS